MSLLVPLERRKVPRYFPVIRLTRALPFVISRNGVYTHRVRAGHVILEGSNPRHYTARHTAINCFCGQNVMVGLVRGLERGGELLPFALTRFPVCHACEEQATRKGYPASSTICGYEVKLSPPRGSTIRHQC